ncbi:fumarylacetoacetate hydrolase family protein [Paraburkholderia sp. MM5384-R2]|uniref:fumarylacetoacetate hydrolase family protein n=1 Tax=Paraburkholderia sp. MM5384-R2 TaxID=2723097 RepID=UPI0016186DE4|nr:fumarylacetoacetate hydrolase family protein [Paraburkholderia sp. MM5384-R2]MBB5503227.1 2-keto-4-pentenoate hydratase/2-oxohepta-3-ene-1,7-dioic acid hydratase in catechol pathway [Paraburkholderia sp. MM5384-R2]
MKSWIRFRLADGQMGFGVQERHRVTEYEGDMFGDAVPSGNVLSRDDVTLLNPCVPTKVVALWNNFHALSEKLGKAAPSHPLFLIKPPTSVIGPGEPIRRPKDYSGKIAYEGELAIVIGKRCRNVSVEEANDHIFGFTCINDVTAAELLNEDVNFAQWCRSKGFDTFSCIGPVIQRDFDWRTASVVTRLDEVERQNYPLADMIFSPAEQVSLISHDMTLLPGDVIACGTSIGVGSIKDGSTVDVSIDGIGVLSNALSTEI